MKKNVLLIFSFFLSIAILGCDNIRTEVTSNTTTNTTVITEAEQTFTEYLLENGFECELGKCTESISDEGELHTAEDEEDWFTWVSYTSSSYHELQNKFVIEDVYLAEWDDGATFNITVYISIYLSSGNVEVTSSSAYLSGDSLNWNDKEATAITTLYGGGWSCTASDEDMSYCIGLKTSVDEWLEEFVIFYNIYENGE